MLGARLRSYGGRDDAIVLGLPRGGVPVAFEIAETLDAPLDVFVVRKLGVPGHEELALGAIASGGVRVVNRRVVEQLSIPQTRSRRSQPPRAASSLAASGTTAASDHRLT